MKPGRGLFASARALRPLALSALLFLVAHPVFATTTIAVESNSAGAGGSVDMCVSMSGSQGRVAGIEMVLRWDGGCATVGNGSGVSAQCDNLVQGKTLSTAIGTRPCNNDSNCLKALLVSVSDTDPIPQDQELFCCDFVVSGSASSTRCPLTLSNVIASDSSGQRIGPIEAVDGVLTIAGVSSTRGATSPGSEDNGGCAIGSGRSAGYGTIPVFVFALLLRRSRA